MDNYIDWHLTSAINEFQNKNFLQAESHLRVVLKILPNHLLCNSLLGLLLGAQNKHEEAIFFLKKAYKLSPNDPSINFNLANAFSSCERHQEAIPHYKLATKLDPQNAKSWLNFGISLSKSKRYEDALRAFEKSREINSKSSEVYISMGAALIGLENYLESIVNLDIAISIKPTSAEAWCNKGICLNKMSEYQKSLECHHKAIELNSNYPEAWCNKGSTLHSMGRYLEATEAFKLATELNPRYVEAWSNMGSSLKELQNYEAALDCQEKAIALNSKYLNAYWNKAVIKHELNQYDEAISLYDYVNKLDPGNPERLWFKSNAQLASGNYAEGWKNYEFRKNIKNSPASSVAKYAPEPITLDQLSGKSLLVISEQGLGDTIQFARYIPMLTNRGVKVSFYVPMSLYALLGTLDGKCQLLTTWPDSSSNFDFQILLLSLPLLFKTTVDTIPLNVPYLKAHDGKVIEWRDRLNLRQDKSNIGIACSGNIKFDLEHGNTRPIPLELLGQLSEVAHLYLIQKEVRPADQQYLDAHPEITYLGPQINDFEDSAAIIQNMDEIITIDTSLAHLAGALGKKTKVLLPFAPDWRWLLDRQDSPWYPSSILYRQESMGEWNYTLERIISSWNIK